MKKLLPAALAVLILVISIWGGTAVLTQGTPEKSVTLPIIMYHSINSDKSKADTYVLYSEDFKKDVELLKKNGFNTVVIQDLIDFVKKGRPLPKKPIVLTFDDGYYNNLLNAEPVLKAAGMRGVISVIAIEADRYTEVSDTHENYACLNWAQINKMLESGVFEFGDHSFDMHRMYEKRLGCVKLKDESSESFNDLFLKDIISSKTAWKINTGYTPKVFTYPFGSSCAESRKLVSENYLASLGVEHKKCTLTCGDDSSLYNMPRFIRTPKITLESILKDNGFLK